MGPEHTAARLSPRAARRLVAVTAAALQGLIDRRSIEDAPAVEALLRELIHTAADLKETYAREGLVRL